MRTWRWYSKVVLALVVAAFAYFVWPTPWTYYQCNPSVGITAPERPSVFGRTVEEYSIWLRLNRFTGKVEVLSSYWGGWEPREQWRDRQLRLLPP